MGVKKDNSLSLDRINNNGNYEPLNCRWTTKLIQRINQKKMPVNYFLVKDKVVYLSNFIKRCYMCGEYKPKGLFYPDKSKTNGLGNRCKECDHRVTVKRWKNYETN